MSTKYFFITFTGMDLAGFTSIYIYLGNLFTSCLIMFLSNNFSSNTTPCILALEAFCNSTPLKLILKSSCVVLLLIRGCEFFCMLKNSLLVLSFYLKYVRLFCESIVGFL